MKQKSNCKIKLIIANRKLRGDYDDNNDNNKTAYEFKKGEISAAKGGKKAIL